MRETQNLPFYSWLENRNVLLNNQSADEVTRALEDVLSGSA